MPPTEEVYLWLGANVMLAYPLDEAESMLQSKLEAATNTLAACEEDLDYLRGQITVRDLECIAFPGSSLWTRFLPARLSSNPFSAVNSAYQSRQSTADHPLLLPRW